MTRPLSRTKHSVHFAFPPPQNFNSPTFILHRSSFIIHQFSPKAAATHPESSADAAGIPAQINPPSTSSPLHYAPPDDRYTARPISRTPPPRSPASALAPPRKSSPAPAAY